jgi:hypothetical protein
MEIEEAKRLIRDESITRPGWMWAAAVLSDPQNAGDVTIDDLLVCLRRPNCGGAAALALYRRTGRPGGNEFETFSTDYEDWHSYLVERGFIQ